eukprot:g16507.t1
MQSSHFQQLQGLLEPGYVQQAEQQLNSVSKKITTLLSQRRLPKDPWTDLEIESFLRQVSLLDANNALGNVGVGEREGRVFSRLVEQRHFGFTHGVGRSGDLVAQQPKAAGSSLLANLAKYLALDAVRLSGFKNCKSCIVCPLATGMSMTLTFLAMQQRDDTPNKTRKFVLWSRIDQKSCFKAINTAGLQPIIVELKKTASGEGLETDVDAMRDMVMILGPENVLCVFLTTSTFAPRVPDKVEEVAKMCHEENVALLINNAYGLQCAKTMQAIETASRKGRVDVVIQSTDKNFMVPVGGAIICAPAMRPPPGGAGGGRGGQSLSPAGGGGKKISPPKKVENNFVGETGGGTTGKAAAGGGEDVEESPSSAATKSKSAGTAAPEEKALRAVDGQQQVPDKEVDIEGAYVVVSPTATTTTPPPAASTQKSLLDQIAQCYPGRASGTAMLDLLITFLSMGESGLQALWKQRKLDFIWFREELKKTVSGHNLRLLDTRDNKISICVDLSGLCPSSTLSCGGDGDHRKKLLNSVGAKLFNHRVSGPRVVACPAGPKQIDGYSFDNYGAHSDTYEFPYLATAVAIGATREELTLFLMRLDKILRETSATGPGATASR